MTRLLVALLGVGLLLAVAGCESTRAKSARLERAGKGALVGAKGLRITRRAVGVDIVERAVLADRNGAAVVLVLRTTAPKPLADVPVGIDVLGRGGRSVYRNDDAGLDRSLTSVPLLAAGGDTAWVDDQVDASQQPRDVRAEVGAPRGGVVAQPLPAISLGAPKLAYDPASGAEAVGKARLDSGPAQRQLVISCVARRRGRVVAAGRAIVPHLDSRRAQSYHVFFIGDPRGARLSLSAPPTVLREAS